MKKLLILFIAAFTLSNLNAQNEPDPKKLKIVEVSIMTGDHLEKPRVGFVSDFRILAPQSVLLDQDLSNIKRGLEYGTNANSYYSVLMGILLNQHKSNTLLRFGLSYSSRTSLGVYYMKDPEKRVIDTLTSSLSGDIYLVEAEKNESLSMNYSSEYLSLETSLIFRTNPEARFSLFAGIGVAPGISFNSKTEIYQTETDRVISQINNYNNYFASRITEGEFFL